ncbi:MAG: DNA repair protein RecO [Candidatus Geothermincolia bacterium]
MQENDRETCGARPDPSGRATERSGRPRPDYHDEGIILRTYKLGESDKILRVMTREHGKRSAVGKGVRKTLSRFGARLEPLTYAKLHLHRGRTMDVVKQAEILTSFQELRDDLDLFVAASSIAELVDTLAAEDEPNRGLFELLLLGLQLLNERPDRARFTLAFFEFKVMGQAGFELMIGRCAGCGGEYGDDIWFSLALGGFVCGACRAGRPAQIGKLIKVSTACAGMLAWMSANRLGDWPRDTDAAVSTEMEMLMGRVLEHWMEREFRSRRVRREIPGAPLDTAGG